MKIVLQRGECVVCLKSMWMHIDLVFLGEKGVKMSGVKI